MVRLNCNFKIFKKQNMKRLLLILTLLMGYILPGQAQTIKFKLSDVKDTTVYLVRYEGSSMYYADTTEMKNGTFSFDGSKQKPGIFTFSIKGARYFDFIYNNEEIHIESDTKDLYKSMNIKKSQENQVYYDYLKYINDKRGEATALNEKYQSLGEDQQDEKDKITKQQEEMSAEVLAYQHKLIETYPKLFVTKIVRMAIEVDIPEAPKGEDGKPLENYAYYYRLKHFFDNIDLEDDRLANTPMLQSKLEYFFSKNHMVQNPDTIIKYVTPLIDEMEAGSALYKLFVFRTTLHFQRSKVMGMDKGYHYMILNYWCPQDENGNYKAYWYPANKMEEACESAAKKAVTDLGSVPPNVILRDTSDTKWRGFYDIDAEYTILYFWDPDCGHCKKETPKLAKLYNEKLKDRNVEVFAIGKATGEDFEKWKAFIIKHNMTFINVGLTQTLFEEATENPYAFVPRYTTPQSLNYQEAYDIYSTPQIFVLDKDKKIVAKQLSIAQLEMFIDQMQNMMDAEKLFDVEEEQNV